MLTISIVWLRVLKDKKCRKTKTIVKKECASEGNRYISNQKPQHERDEEKMVSLLEFVEI